MVVIAITKWQTYIGTGYQEVLNDNKSDKGEINLPGIFFFPLRVQNMEAFLFSLTHLGRTAAGSEVHTGNWQ